MTRREVMQTAAFGSLAINLQAAAPFTLPKLPYALDALEPHIDAKTMEIHHGKHHQAYINNLNQAVQNDAQLSQLSVEDLLRKLDSVPARIRTAVRNNGGGHANHSLFWQTIGPAKGSRPKEKLAAAIWKNFQNQETLESRLKTAATGVFGSGWAWLVLNASGELEIQASPNQDSPLLQGKQPVLGIDVWEHAYYLKYQNRRPDYLSAFFNVVNWDFVSTRYEQLIG